MNINSSFTEVKSIRQYCEQAYASKLDNLNKRGNFLEMHNYPDWLKKIYASWINHLSIKKLVHFNFRGVLGLQKPWAESTEFPYSPNTVFLLLICCICYNW